MKLRRQDEKHVWPFANGPLHPVRVAEFLALYLAAPVAHATFYAALGTFAPLAVLLAVACVLLALTPSFSWRGLIDCRGLGRQLPLIAGFAVACAVVLIACVMALVPERLFGFPRYNTDTWITVMLLYPPISVLGQELIYRALFFHRYAALMPNRGAATVVNALVFALGHAFYQNWVAFGLTFIGGLVFAWVYARTASFPLVFILHSLAGQILFTSGLGVYFYHGAIPSG